MIREEVGLGSTTSIQIQFESIYVDDTIQSRARKVHKVGLENLTAKLEGDYTRGHGHERGHIRPRHSHTCIVGE